MTTRCAALIWRRDLARQELAFVDLLNRTLGARDEKPSRTIQPRRDWSWMVLQGGKITPIVFALTAAARLVRRLPARIPGFGALTDTAVAWVGGMALFPLPSGADSKSRPLN